MDKLCRKCGKKLPIEKFYTHPQMADGHLNICIECVKTRVNEHREKNLERIRAYDRERGKLPHRKKLRSKNVNKRKAEDEAFEQAHRILGNSIRDKKVIKGVLCQVCGAEKDIEGHHFDYSQPLQVIWLCKVCHRQYHLGKSNRAKMVKVIVDAISDIRTIDITKTQSISV